MSETSAMESVKSHCSTTDLYFSYWEENPGILAFFCFFFFFSEMGRHFSSVCDDPWQFLNLVSTKQSSEAHSSAFALTCLERSHLAESKRRWSVRRDHLFSKGRILKLRQHRHRQNCLCVSWITHLFQGSCRVWQLTWTSQVCREGSSPFRCRNKNIG